jgi:HK97 gp10 family phage protein
MINFWLWQSKGFCVSNCWTISVDTLMKAEFKLDLSTLDDLKKGMSNKIMRIALMKAAGTVKEAVISNSPAGTGALKKSIKIRVRNYNNSSVWVAVVGPKSSYTKAKGKIKRGPHKGEPRIYRPAKYAQLLEHGTKHAGARPFLGPAMTSSKEAFATIFLDKVKSQVTEILK